MGASTMRRAAWALGASILLFGPPLVGCEAVLGLDSLKDGPPPDASAQGEDGGRQTDDGGQTEATLTDGNSVPDGGAGPDSTPPDGGPDADTTDASDDAHDSGFVDAADGSACPFACTVGLTECDDGGVETCEAEPGSCPAWVQTTGCGPHQTCGIGPDAGAACTCVSTPCEQNGTVCENAQTQATCATDSNNCPYVSATTICSSPASCSGTAPTASCSLTCSNSCNQGDTACVSGELATCTLGSNGCWAYGTPAPCKSSYETCTGTAGSAQCLCNPDPICQGAASYCASSSSTVVSCTQDSQSCWYESGTQPCTGGACFGTAGSVSCCTNVCAVGTEQCAPGGGIETCVVVDGCTTWSTQPCKSAYESCTGAAGSAKCTCNSDPICEGAATYCANSASEVVSCAQDTSDPAQTCWYESGSQACSSGACFGTAGSASCCTNACTAGAEQCASGRLETCAAVNGCTVWGAALPCATGEVCNSATTTCEAGCYIGGTYYAPNAAGPTSCQSCQPAVSTTSWSNLANGTACGASGSNDLCSGGACDPSCYIFSTYRYQGYVESCSVCWPPASTTQFSSCAVLGETCAGGTPDDPIHCQQ
jgi:hypothetical protein